MNTVMRLSLGLLFAASLMGCHTCYRGGCAYDGCGGGCQDACGCDGEFASCDCQNHGPHVRHSRIRSKAPSDATAHGYDGSVVYSGDDWQGIPQQQGAMPGMPMQQRGYHQGGMPPQMMGPSGGCSSCGSGHNSPIPGDGGCASCGSGGGQMMPQAAPGGCASCGTGTHPTPATPPSGGNCASCGTGTPNDSFYSPIAPNPGSPAPDAPPSEGIPGQNNDGKAAGQGESIQKINWVPRQL